MPFSISLLVSCLFMQFVTITQPLLNSLQCHVSPTLIVIFQFLFLFIRIIGMFDVIFHTFNCRLLEFIKIRTLNLTGYELLCNCAILIAIKKAAYMSSNFSISTLFSIPFSKSSLFIITILLQKVFLYKSFLNYSRIQNVSVSSVLRVMDMLLTCHRFLQKHKNLRLKPQIS